MLLIDKKTFNAFSSSTALSIVQGLRAKREKLLIESPSRRKKSSTRASSLPSPNAKTKQPKFASPLLEQLFSGMSKEMQDIVLGKKKKK